MLGVAHADHFVVQIGAQKAIFRGFTKFFSELLDCNKLLILIESTKYFIGNQQKIGKWVWS